MTMGLNSYASSKSRIRAIIASLKVLAEVGAGAGEEAAVADRAKEAEVPEG